MMLVAVVCGGVCVCARCRVGGESVSERAESEREGARARVYVCVCVPVAEPWRSDSWPATSLQAGSA